MTIISVVAIVVAAVLLVATAIPIGAIDAPSLNEIYYYALAVGISVWQVWR